MNSHSLPDLVAQGYVQAPPPNYEAATIDREVCRESTCDVCGHTGLDYVPYIRKSPFSYRAFARCPMCGHKIEF